MYNFLHSTEFLVIIFTLTALLVGMIVKPSHRGQAETSFARGLMSYDPDTTPRVEFSCMESGEVAIRRCGLPGLTDSATVALAITRIGFDIAIEERITEGSYLDPEANAATFFIGPLGHERYHISYNSAPCSLFLATTLTNHPGIAFTRTFPAS